MRAIKLKELTQQIFTWGSIAIAKQVRACVCVCGGGGGGGGMTKRGHSTLMLTQQMISIGFSLLPIFLSLRYF